MTAMETVAELALRLDGCLARYEPLALIAAPLLALLVARLVHAGVSSPSLPSSQRSPPRTPSFLVA